MAKWHVGLRLETEVSASSKDEAIQLAVDLEDRVQKVLKRAGVKGVEVCVGTVEK